MEDYKPTHIFIISNDNSVSRAATGFARVGYKHIALYRKENPGVQSIILRIETEY